MGCDSCSANEITILRLNGELHNKERQLADITEKFKVHKLQWKGKMAQMRQQLEAVSSNAVEGSAEARLSSVVNKLEETEGSLEESQATVTSLKNELTMSQANISDHLIRIKSLEQQVESLQSTANSLALVDKCKPNTENDMQNMYAQMVYKDTRMLELNNVILAKDTQIVDLQELCREREEVTSAKTRAIQIISKQLEQASFRPTTRDVYCETTLTNIVDEPICASIIRSPGRAVPLLMARTGSPPPADPTDIDEMSSMTTESLQVDLDNMDLGVERPRKIKKIKKRVTFDFSQKMRDERVAELEEKVKELEMVGDELRDENDEFRSSLSELEQCMDDVTQRHKDTQLQYKLMLTHNDQLQAELDAAQKERKAASLKAKAQAQTKIKELEEDNVSLSEQLHHLQIDHKEIMTQNQHLQQTIHKYRFENDELQDRVDALDIDCRALNEGLRSKDRLTKKLECKLEASEDAFAQAQASKHRREKHESEALAHQLKHDMALMHADNNARIEEHAQLTHQLVEAQRTADNLLSQKKQVLTDVESLKDAMETSQQVIEYLQDQLDHVTQQLAELRCTKGEITQELQKESTSHRLKGKALWTKLIQEQADKSELLSRLAESNKQLALKSKGLHTKTRCFEAEKKELLDEMNDVKTSLKHLQDQQGSSSNESTPKKSSLEIENKSLKRRLEEISGEMTSLKSQNKTLSDEKTDIDNELQELWTRESDMKRGLGEADGISERLREERDKLRKQCALFTSNEEKLNEQVSEFYVEKQELNNEVCSLKDRVLMLETSSSEETKDIASQMANFKQYYQNILDEKETLTQSLEQALKNIETLRDNKKMLQDDLFLVKSEFEEAESSHKTQVDDLMRSIEKWRETSEIQQQQINENEENVARLKQDLESSKQNLQQHSPNHFMLQQMQKLKTTAAELRAHANGLTESHRVAVESHAHDSQYVAQTIIYNIGALQSYMDSQWWVAYNAQQQNILDVTAQLTQTQTQLNEAQAQLSLAQSQNENLHNQFEVMERSEIGVVELSKQLQIKVTALETELEKMNNEHGCALDLVKELEGKLKVTEKELKEILERERDYVTQLQDKHTNFGKMENEAVQLRQELASQSLILAQLEADHENLKNSVQSIQSELTENELKLSEANLKLQESESANETLRVDIERMREEVLENREVVTEVKGHNIEALEIETELEGWNDDWANVSSQPSPQIVDDSDYEVSIGITQTPHLDESHGNSFDIAEDEIDGQMSCNHEQTSEAPLVIHEEQTMEQLSTMKKKELMINFLSLQCSFIQTKGALEKLGSDREVLCAEIMQLNKHLEHTDNQNNAFVIEHEQNTSQNEKIVTLESEILILRHCLNAAKTEITTLAEERNDVSMKMDELCMEHEISSHELHSHLEQLKKELSAAEQRREELVWENLSREQMSSEKEELAKELETSSHNYSQLYQMYNDLLLAHRASVEREVICEATETDAVLKIEVMSQTETESNSRSETETHGGSQKEKHETVKWKARAKRLQKDIQQIKDDHRDQLQDLASILSNIKKQFDDLSSDARNFKLSDPLEKAIPMILECIRSKESLISNRSLQPQESLLPQSQGSLVPYKDPLANIQPTNRLVDVVSSLKQEHRTLTAEMASMRDFWRHETSRIMMTVIKYHRVKQERLLEVMLANMEDKKLTQFYRQQSLSLQQDLELALEQLTASKMAWRMLVEEKERATETRDQKIGNLEEELNCLNSELVGLKEAGKLHVAKRNEFSAPLLASANNNESMCILQNDDSTTPKSSPITNRDYISSSNHPEYNNSYNPILVKDKLTHLVNLCKFDQSHQNVNSNDSGDVIECLEIVTKYVQSQLVNSKSDVKNEPKEQNVRLEELEKVDTHLHDKLDTSVTIYEIVKVLEDKIDGLENKCSTIRMERNELEMKIATMESQLYNNQVEHELSQQNKSEIEVKCVVFEMQKKVELLTLNNGNLNSDNDGLLEDIEAHKSENTVLMEENAALQQLSAMCKEQVKMCDDKIQSLSNELEIVTMNFDEIQGKLVEKKDYVAKILEKGEQYEYEIKKMKEGRVENETQKSRVEELGAEFEAMKIHCEQLQNKLTAKDFEYDEASVAHEQIIKAVNEELHALTTDSSKIRKEFVELSVKYSVSCANLERLQSESGLMIAENQALVETLKQNLDAHNSRVDLLENENGELKQGLMKYQRELDESGIKAQRLSEEMAKLCVVESELKQDNQRLVEEMDSLGRELLESRDVIEKMQDRERDIRMETVTLVTAQNTELGNLAPEKNLNLRIDELEHTLELSCQECESLKEENVRLAIIKDELQKKLDEAEKRLAHEDSKIVQLYRKLEEAETKLNCAIDSRIDVESELNCVEDAHSTIDAELRAVKADKLRLEDELLSLKEANIRIDKQMKVVMDSNANIDAQLKYVTEAKSSLETELQTFRSEVERNVHNSLQENELNVKEKIVCKQQLENVELKLKESQERYVQLENSLKIKQAEFKEVVDQKSTYCDEMKDRMRLVESELNEAVTSRNAMQIKLSDVKEKQDENMQQRDCDENKEQFRVDELLAEKEVLKNMIEKMQAMAVENSSKIEKLQEELSEAQTKLLLSERKVEQSLVKIKDVTGIMNSLEKGKINLLKKQETHERRIEKMKQEITKLQCCVGQTSEERLMLEETINDSIKQRDDALQHIGQLKEITETKDRQIEVLRIRLEESEEQVKDSDVVEIIRLDNEKLTAIIDAIKQTETHNCMLIHELTQEKEACMTRIESMLENNLKLEERIADVISQNQTHNTTIAQITIENTALSNEINQLKWANEDWEQTETTALENDTLLESANTGRTTRFNSLMNVCFSWPYVRSLVRRMPFSNLHYWLFRIFLLVYIGFIHFLAFF